MYRLVFYRWIDGMLHVDTNNIHHINDLKEAIRLAQEDDDCEHAKIYELNSNEVIHVHKPDQTKNTYA